MMSKNSFLVKLQSSPIEEKLRIGSDNGLVPGVGVGLGVHGGFIWAHIDH